MKATVKTIQGGQFRELEIVPTETSLYYRNMEFVGDIVLIKYPNHSSLTMCLDEVEFKYKNEKEQFNKLVNIFKII